MFRRSRRVLIFLLTHVHTHAYAFNVQAPIHCVHHRSHDYRNNKVSHCTTPRQLFILYYMTRSGTFWFLKKNMLYPHTNLCACTPGLVFEAFVDDTRSRRRPTEQCSGKASACTAQGVALRTAALAHLQEKAPREATCPGRRGKVFFVSSLCVRFLQSACFGYRQTEMKHNKFKTNKLTATASHDQSQKPQQEDVFKEKSECT